MRKEIYEEWQGKKVAVVGLGVSNMALIEFLQNKGAQVFGRDQKTAAELKDQVQKLRALGVELILGPGYLRGLTGYDAVFLTPGIPKHLPELKGLDFLSEIALVFRYSEAPIYAITGSSGKTTVTALIGEMLRQAALAPFLGGNIGTPLITEIEKAGPGDSVVLELSSFQLERLGSSPHGALLTNISENHLDVHQNMANYIEAKREIYRHQSPGDFAIFNYDDKITRQMAKEAKGRVYFFSLEAEVEKGAYLKGGDLFYRDENGTVDLGPAAKLSLLGPHNAANFLAAAIMAHLIGADWESIREAGRVFPGVPHRLELIASKNGVKYYNDSIATTPQRTITALRSLQAPIILIAGGSDKKLSFDELGKAIHCRVKKLLLIGYTAPQIKKAVEKYGAFPLVMAETLDRAVKLAAKEALPGDVVLLSPACASYDQYESFAARGAHFRTLVENLNKS